MREQVRSLNLSATAAAAMYEAVRQLGVAKNSEFRMQNSE